MNRTTYLRNCVGVSLSKRAVWIALIAALAGSFGAASGGEVWPGLGLGLLTAVVLALGVAFDSCRRHSGDAQARRSPDRLLMLGTRASVSPHLFPQPRLLSPAGLGLGRPRSSV